MSDLKIKVSLGSFNVELEGPSEDVITQFDEIKKNGLGQMVDQLAPLFIQNKITQDKFIEATDDEKNIVEFSSDLPQEDISLKNVVIKMLPQFESEWILVYSHYIALEGKTSFSRADIISKYVESSRKTKARMKNLSSSINGAVRKNWISALNDTEYIITEPGKTAAKLILQRTGGTSKPPRSKQKKEKDVKDTAAAN